MANVPNPNHYPYGQPVAVTGTWTNPVGGAPQDPTTPQVDIVDPTGKTTTYTTLTGVVRVSTGVYQYSVDTTGKAGRYQYRWWSPGPTGQGAGQSEFISDPFPAPAP